MSATVTFIPKGGTLWAGEFLVSPNSSYVAFSTNGNFEVYAAPDFNESNRVWDSNTATVGGPVKLIDPHCTLDVSPWSSSVVSVNQACRLELRETGNLVIYGNNDSVLWVSEVRPTVCMFSSSSYLSWNTSRMFSSQLGRLKLFHDFANSEFMCSIYHFVAPREKMALAKKVVGALELFCCADLTAAGAEYRKDGCLFQKGSLLFCVSTVF